MSSQKIKLPKYKIGDIITYDSGNQIDIVSGFQWFTGIYKYYLLCTQNTTIDEEFIDQKIGTAEFD
jgi:hypothetical protein